MEETNKAIAVLQREMPNLKAILALTNPGADVETMAYQELENLRAHSLTKPEIIECEPQSIITAVRTALRQNLTLDPAAGLQYVKTRNVKIGGQYKKALDIQPSANGLISINRMCGRILDIERPVVEKDSLGKVVGVSVRYLVPSYNEKGEKCTRWVKIDFDESDIYRWKRASHNENSRGWKAEYGGTAPDKETLNKANPNYTNFKGGPDPEFMRAKAIRHALKKMGANPMEKNIAAVGPEKFHIDPEKDKEALQDEEVGYEEVVETTPDGQQQIKTESGPKSEVKLPNSNQL